ncbi:Chromobox protein [Spraguea lophii 42_110]|uniref:Chromobox protein n=1 Tax=Spraguea lophii (strain 42_110) TaxID=1358809 RepID=S7XVU8_SPRLO|nr:Chromobox protein [Spraguea lophii 42_110]
MPSDNVYNVEKIVDVRVVKGRKQYLIKWEGYPDSENTWQFASDIFCKDLITVFENDRKTKTKKKSVNKSKDKPVEEEVVITNAWDKQVLKVIQVQPVSENSKELEVLVEFKNGKVIGAPLKDVHAKCPLKLLKYYEENLSFAED